MARQKEDIVRDICEAVGSPMIPLGPGSKEKKAVFEAVRDRLDLDLDGGLGKPDLARAIVERGGLQWDATCESAGDTITNVGLERVLAATRAIAGDGDVEVIEDAGGLGQPYVSAHPNIDAPPATLVLDWDDLDASTKAHAALQNEIAALLERHGIQPRSPHQREPMYDLAWEAPDGSIYVCEVKSSTPDNESQQLRLGLGQVLEYRYRLQRDLGGPVKAVVAISSGGSLGRGVCGAAGVRLLESATLEDDLASVLGLEEPSSTPAPPAAGPGSADSAVSGIGALPERHRAALRWFRDHAGEETGWPDPLPDGSLLVCRPKGIYKPAWSTYALSVRQGLGGEYPDKDPEPLPGGRWTYRYFQESHDPSGRDDEFTNRGLIRCMQDGVPVGVMRKVKEGAHPTYEVLGLAHVVSWEDGYFDLEGPVDAVEF